MTNERLLRQPDEATMSKTAASVVPKWLEWVGSGCPEDDDVNRRAEEWAAARRYIETGPPCHLVTIARDGTPHITVVWVGLDGGDLLIPHLLEYVKIKNMRRDPRVSVSFASGSKTDMGAYEYLVVEGTAEVTQGGAPVLLQRLARTYLGPGVKYPPMDHPPEGYITRITPSRFRGWAPGSSRFPAEPVPNRPPSSSPPSCIRVGHRARPPR